MTRRAIYFWEPCLSPHKLALFRALLAHPHVDGCVYVTQEPLLEERIAQGWELGAIDDLDVRIAPDAQDVRRIVTDAPNNALHLFSGIHWVPCIVNGIRAAVDAGASFFIMTEPRVREGARGLMRLAHSWVTEHHVRRNAAGVLAIGRNGPPWFRRAGYQPAHIFPFAYFLPVPSRVERGTDALKPTVAYLGRLNRAKGIRLFMDAAVRLHDDVAVHIAGTGEDIGLVEAFCAQSPNRHFHGPIPMSATPRFLADVDVLVVPSITTDDGWGAVVSEALMAGAAVVATSQVGASICLDARWRGTTLPSLSPARLATAIADQLERNGADPQLRDRRAIWAKEHLSGVAGAAYLMDIVAHRFGAASRPLPFYTDRDAMERP